MGGVFLAILTVFSIALWGYAQQAANRSYDRLLHGAGLAVLERVNIISNEITVDIPYSSFEILSLAPDDRIFYRIFTQDGRTITSSHDLRSASNYKPSERPVYWDDAYSGEPVRFMQQARLLTGDDQSLWVITQIGQTCIARHEMIADLFWRGFAVALFITILGLLFVWIGINRVLHPLIDIEKNLRHRDISDFTPLAISPPREVASLIRSINSFISRLQDNLDHSQAFIADVTHQIRTALSSLQGHLELAARETDESQFRNRLDRAALQSKQTIHLTNQLLAHAMVIHRADQKIKDAFHLAQVVKSTLETILREHLKSDIEFSLFIDPALESGKPDADLIVGDSISVREAIRNIIDNAIKHGPANNQIVISLKAKGRQLVLTVEDAGPGIPANERASVLERFYTTARNGEGSGLGLSIVQEVAKSHGARLRLSQSSLGGAEVALHFRRRISNV